VPLGLAVQYVLRRMQDFIPVTIPFSFLGVRRSCDQSGISLLFSASRLGLRRVLPLAIRASYEESTERHRDLWRYGLLLI
jgi:hypothetical protein